MLKLFFMYEEIKIENFRGIKSLELKDFKKVNLFVGKNNCGKTSILEAIFWSLNPLDINIPVSLGIFRNFHGSEALEISNFFKRFETSLKSFFYRLEDNKISISSKIFGNKEKIEIEPYYGEENILDLNILSKKGKFQSKEVIKGLKFNFPLKNIDFKVFIKNENNNYSFVIDPLDLNSDIKNITTYKGRYLNDEISKIGDAIKEFSDLLNNKKEEDLFKLLREIEPSLEDILITENSNLLVNLSGIKKRLPFEIMGDGFKRIFRIAVFPINDNKTLKNGGVLLIDEIENGLHYSIQKLVWEFLIKLAKENNFQIFATTHSLDCIQALMEIGTQDSDDIRVYKLFKTEEDLFKTATYNKTKLNIALDEMNLEIR